MQDADLSVLSPMLLTPHVEKRDAAVVQERAKKDGPGKDCCVFCSSLANRGLVAPCGLRGCKNRPAPFPGRMSYMETKPGSVCPVS